MKRWVGAVCLSRVQGALDGVVGAIVQVSAKRSRWSVPISETSKFSCANNSKLIELHDN